MLLFEKLTLTGRSYALIFALLIANLAGWAAALALFAPRDETRRVLALCAVAWTTGLRHALDADHISAIDNATRQMVNAGKQPITCGLFFSLGHSTIVLAVTIAIAISIDVSNRLNSASVIGGIIGQSVSASFLFLLGCINTFFLYRALKEKKQRESQPDVGASTEHNKPHMMGCMGRIARPLLRLIDSPWKLYPIGVLFGLGFDTASEVGLLGVAALAQSQTGDSVPASYIIILPVLFTCGMALVDSLDAILVLWGYVLPNVKGENWKVLFRSPVAEAEPLQSAAGTVDIEPYAMPVVEAHGRLQDGSAKNAVDEEEKQQNIQLSEPTARDQSTATPPAYSQLSIALTAVSIAVAFAISIIEFMGIALDQCESCSESADNDPGLTGNWWRFWATMNDNSGYVGAGIMAFMLLLLIGFYLWGKRQKKRQSRV